MSLFNGDNSLLPGVTPSKLLSIGEYVRDLDDARRGYYRDLFPLNPGGIVPAGPSPRDLGWPEETVRDENAFAWRDAK